MWITMSFDSIMFPLDILCYDKRNTAHVIKILLQASPRIWVDFFQLELPRFQKYPLSDSPKRWFVSTIFVPYQTTSLNTKLTYKRKLSLRNVLDIWPKYGQLSNLAEIMEILSFDVAKEHRKPRDGPAI